MSIIGGALKMGRQQAEARMRDSCNITDPSSTVPVWNETKLDYDHVPAVTYTGKCRIRFGNVGVQSGVQGEQLFVEQDATLHLPIDSSTAVRKDHVVEVTASASDPSLVGAKFVVGAARRQSDTTARRLPIKETQ